MTPKNSATAVVYQEKVSPSIALYLPVLFVFPAVLLVVLPISGWQTATIAGACVTALAAFGVSKLGHAIVIQGSGASAHIRVGQAQIEMKHVGELTVIAGADLGAATGPQLHALSYRKLQPKTGFLVKIEVTDERDSTPYWIFSSRKPKELSEAFRKVKAS